MITLKNGTKGTSQIGRMVKVSKRDGYFEMAGVGDDPIGVISESVPVNAPCVIVTNGETLVYMHKRVLSGGEIRFQRANDGAPKGSGMPVGTEEGLLVIGYAVETGKGLVRCTVIFPDVHDLFAYGGLFVHDNATTVSVPTGTTYVVFDNIWTDSGHQKDIVGDTTAGTLTINNIGFFLVNGSFSLKAGTNNPVIRVAMFMDGVEQHHIHYKDRLGNAATVSTGSFTGILHVEKTGTVVDVRLRHDLGGTVAFTVDYANYNVSKIGYLE